MSAALNTTTQAEGLPRRPFTFEEVEREDADLLARRFNVADVVRMVEVGDERLELIDGEIVDMSPKGDRHVINVASRRLHRHREPNGPAYALIDRVDAGTRVEPAFGPSTMGFRLLDMPER